MKIPKLSPIVHGLSWDPVILPSTSTHAELLLNGLLANFSAILYPKRLKTVKT